MKSFANPRFTLRGRLAACIAALIVLGFVVGCTPTKSVDEEVTGAQLVPGTGNLWWFCHGPTAIYFTNRESVQDEYEFIVYDGCATDPAAAPRAEAVPEDDQ